MGRKLEQCIAILNGAVGDHLARSHNGLATEMSLVARGVCFPASAVAAHLGGPPCPRVAIFVHGLMSTETIWAFANGTDYGSRLTEDLGVTAIHVRYNSGRAIPENGEALSLLLEQMLTHYPVPIEELMLLGYSMGGLVVRSACQAARETERRWLEKVRRAIYVGTPHRGAPMERAGRVVARILLATGDPYARLFADIANARSRGVKDLGEGASAWTHPLPLLPSMAHYLAAGSLSGDPTLSRLFGDAIVPVASATDGHHAQARALPADHVRVFPGLSHIDIAHDEAVYAQIRTWVQV
jgi:triacylglycerol lipase